MRIEEIYFYKLILLCGYPDELNQTISNALDNQNPIEPDILDLSACRGDVKKQLSVLNAILARNGEDLLDRKVIFELVRRFLHQQYVAGMDISTLVKLMYRISKETGWHDEEPWNSLFLMEDYYDDAQWGINGMEDFRHQLECLLTPTSFERDCAVPISAIKQQLILYEQQGMRLPVYRYLKDLWNTSFRTEDLTVLIMQQMMFYLIELESPWVTWETEDEHQTYQSFLHEALAYGLEAFSHEKKFMWNLCFFLEASSVYHCIFGDQIPIGSENILKKKLYEEAKNRYPTSVMFDVIPLIQGGDPLWRDKISDDAKKTLIAEVNEWNLMTNMVDEDLQELLCVTEEKSNRNDGVRDLPPSSISLCEKYMKSRTKLFLALCIAGIVIVVTLCVYQNNSRSNIDRLNQAILQSPALESASYDVELLMSSLSDSVRNAIVEVVPVHNAFDTHTGTWIVTQKGFATKRGIFLSTELLAEIPKSQNFGIAIEPLGNVNGVYSYLLEYYWD